MELLNGKEGHLATIFMFYSINTILVFIVYYRYNIKRGYGYIMVDDGGPDMFVHATGLKTSRSLRRGNRVRFATMIDKRTSKPKAINVKSTSKTLSISCKAEVKTSTVHSNPCTLKE